MDPITTEEVIHDFHPFFRIYKGGRTERFVGTALVPPSDDPQTGVRSKDVVISLDPKVSARLYLPKTTDHCKLPVLVYIHGGAFTIESAFSTLYHNYLNSLVAVAGVIAVSVEYRLAPEHHVPACYEDSWTAMKWVALHNDGQGPDPWLNDHADLGRVFLAGDSAGANIAHDMAVRADQAEGIGCGVKVSGMILVHPFFGGDKFNDLWRLICPETSGLDDPRLNPTLYPGVLGQVGSKKVLICTAGKDELKKGGWSYYEGLKKSEWGGDQVEIVETEEEDHVFHLFNPSCERAGSLMKLVSSFLNQN